MLVGMGLFKFGVFSALRSDRVYVGFLAAAAFFGVPIILYGLQTIFSEVWRGEYAMFFGSMFNYGGSLFVSLGWIGAVMLIYKSEKLRFITRPLAAVGRMALTNYLMHSIICTTIFYGHGFGMFGQVERVGQILIVAAIWAIQLIVSPIWLRHFRFGLLEWLWRSLTYWRLQPVLRRGDDHFSWTTSTAG